MFNFNINKNVNTDIIIYIIININIDNRTLLPLSAFFESVDIKRGK